MANQWEPSFLFRNTAPKAGAFLGLHLRLPVGPQTGDKTVVLKGHPRADRPSRPAIGAAVKVHQCQLLRPECPCFLRSSCQIGRARWQPTRRPWLAVRR